MRVGALLMYFLFLLVTHRRRPQERKPLTEKIQEDIEAVGRKRGTIEMDRTIFEEYEDKGRKQGRKEGIQAGVIRAKQDDLLKLMGLKFGPVPDPLTRRLRRLKDTAKLDGYLERILQAETLEAMGIENRS